MLGTMMNSQLTLTPILGRAAALFGKVEIISRRPDRSLHRYRYADFCRRARRLAGALQSNGLQHGDRVATLMWNSYAHLECYFGIPCAGGVMHTLNLRLHPDELAYIADHAGDRFLIVDDSLLPLLEQLRERVRFERVWVVRFGSDPLPKGTQDYEELLQAGPDDTALPELNEQEAAAMCYTSGTTGKPKGVVYSHRALALHSLALSLSNGPAISHYDTVMPAMSMFHANAWGTPYAAVMMGSRLVFPGRHVDAASLLELMENEQVTFTGAVPTVWVPVLEALEAEPKRWRLSPRLRVMVAGSAMPESMAQRFDRFAVHAMQLWGLTETTPIATACWMKQGTEELSQAARNELRAKQGLPQPFIEMRVMNESGEAPWDGSSLGEIELRGPWIASSYYNMEDSGEKWTADGWFRTGDIVHVDAEGYVKIADRAKDLIKSGGEWISSVDVENALVAHPAVREAAVVGVHHPRWQERPLAVMVLNPGSNIGKEELRSFLEKRFARWQVPDDFVFVEALPHSSTGKLMKRDLRERYKDWKWEECQAPKAPAT